MKNSISSEIAALPTDWVPIKKPSNVIEKLNKEKKQNHEHCIQELENELTTIRDNYDAQIKEASKLVKATILNMKENIEDLINQHTFNFKTGSAYVEDYEAIFLELGNKVISLCQPVKVTIQEHETDLKRLETDRMNKFKLSLKQASVAMNQICYKLPQDVHTFIENEMIQMNQITLSNYYNYSELIAQLLDIVISNENRWLKSISDLRNDYAIGYQAYLQTKNKSKPKDNSIDNELSELQNFAEKISNELVQISADSIGVIELMHNFLSQINDGHFDEAQQLKLQLSDEIPKRSYLAIYDEVYQSLFDNSRNSEDNKQMKEQWQECVDMMKKEVHFCRQATAAALHLFDKHFQRIFDATAVFSLDLYDVINLSINNEDGLFIELHKAIDNVRTSSSEENLKISMGTCKKLIDKMLQLIQKDFDKQQKTFDKYRNLRNIEADILYLEMNYHLKQQPSGDDVNATIFRGRRSQTHNQYIDDRPNLMKEFDADVKALHNWLFGINFHLQNAATSCHEIATENANTWIKQQSIILIRNFELKRNLIEDNYQQLFHNVYRVRLAELIFHEKRLKQHILGITRELENLQLTTSVNNKYNKYSKCITRFRENIKTIENDLNEAKHPILIISNKMKNFANGCFEELSRIKDEVNGRNNIKINQLLSLNICYLQSIKFFSENGNYSLDEIPEIKQQFTQINKTVIARKLELEQSIELDYQLGLNEVKAIDKEITEKISEYKKHFEFKQFLKNHATEVTGKLRKETHELIDKGNQLSAYVLHLQTLAKKNIGIVEYLDDFTDNCEYMKQIFQELYVRLIQQEIFNLNNMLFTSSDSSIAVNTNNEDLDIMGKLNAKFDKTDKSSGHSIEIMDKFHLVFSHIPEGDNYMARIVKILFESLELLQTRAQEYYKDMMKDGSYEEKEKFNLRLRSLMIDHLAKYLYYQMQSDETLLEVTINYILELDSLLSFVAAYYKQSIETFIKIKLKVLSDNCSLIRKDFLKRKLILEESYQQVRDLLKPLYGHPNNKHLLEPLTLQISKIGELGIEYQTKLDEMYLENKNFIEENTEIFEGQIKLMATRLKECVEYFFFLYIEDAHIFNQLKTKFEYFQKIVNGGQCMVTNDSSETMNVEIIDMLNTKLNLLRHNLKISSSRLSAELFKKWDTVSIMKEKYSNSEYILSENESGINIDAFISDFEESQLNCLREIEQEKDILSLCKLWTDIWNNDIQKINSLYMVKYSNPNEIDE